MLSIHDPDRRDGREARAESARGRDIAPGRIDSLIDDRPDDGVFRVHRDALCDPAIFDLEMTHIFESTWVFLGHESEIARPHDFMTTRIGRQNILVMRDGEGTARAFYNSCRHRGSLLCLQHRGNRGSHVCPYHGWTFDSTGKLANLTNREFGAYTPAFEAAEHDLIPIARFDTYRGLMFGSLRADVPPLREHLGDVTTFVDLIHDQSPHGFELVPGRITYTFEANWKWQIENLTDSYHFPFTHGTYLGVLQRQVTRHRKSGDEADSGVSSYANMRQMRGQMGRGCFDLGNGHSAMWGHTPNPLGRPTYLSKDEIFARVGETRGSWMLYTRNLNVYPNLQFHDNIASALVVIRPLKVDRTEVIAYCIGPKGESAEARRRRIRHCEEFLNFGVANPDDLACYEACQAGFADHPDMWMDYARGMGVYEHGPGPHAAEIGIRPKGSVFGPFDMGDETGHQHGFREWRRLLKAGLARGPRA